MTSIRQYLYDRAAFAPTPVFKLVRAIGRVLLWLEHPGSQPQRPQH